MRTFLHATFSPSDRTWLNYDREKIIQRINAARAVQRGTELHELAEHCIKMKTPLDESNGIISSYVKDCIDMGMDTEVTMMYSEDIGGTADAIHFDSSSNTLYVFDLKTGEGRAYFNQVVIYAALWCLIHIVNPLTIKFDLRIYSRTHYQRKTSDDKLGEHDISIEQEVYDITEQIKYVQGIIDETIGKGGYYVGSVE